ncbi:cytochrome c-type biogenesis protein CcmH [Ideonella sp. 4Y11]|uniref:Cytochrome c-type biogenesis protein n=1 Tax=Ideonella aquatica TaxID=2824119 RepID=A0A940YIC0_9BURK|nr:cytochrome c-type biogenesis protein [Ideonella aquatica]MBQ0957577.1 cytochrome c-type biogenesis protein CcmH [Ideonella aquatica]
MARRLLIASALLAAALNTWAGEARSVADDPALEARMMAIATELRCLVCQNQTVADSHAGLAVDLRQQIREQLAAGKTDEQVRAFMTDRYGDFVLYKPPFNARTALLWGGPALLSLGALLGLGWLLRRRARLPDEAFDPETPDEGLNNAPRS